MNGFTITANAYEKYLTENKDITEKDKLIYEKAIRIYKFLGTCSQEEINMLFDSSAFNNIAKAYFRTALRNQLVDDDTIRNVMKEVDLLLDEQKASEILDA